MKCETLRVGYLDVIVAGHPGCEFCGLLLGFGSLLAVVAEQSQESSQEQNAANGGNGHNDDLLLLFSGHTQKPDSKLKTIHVTKTFFQIYTTHTHTTTLG